MEQYRYLGEYGPTYPDLGPRVAKLRRVAANHTISAFKRVAIREHGLAVLEAINTKNRQALQRELSTHGVNCASGTNHTTGAKILEALRQRARQTCNPDAIRRARSIWELEQAYKAAMAQKRKRKA